MNKSVRDISEILFKEWQGKSPLFASSLTLDLEWIETGIRYPAFHYAAQ